MDHDGGLDLAVSNWDRENYVFTNLVAINEDVSINVLPKRREVAPGDSLVYRMTPINNTGSYTQATVLGRVFLPCGSSFAGNPIYGPQVVDLGPCEAVDCVVAYWIPPRDLFDRGRFTLTVTAVSGNDRSAAAGQKE
jgi:hypothetical protein